MTPFKNPEEEELGMLLHTEKGFVDRDWDPPHGDMPLEQLASAELMDAKYASSASIYRFPWYLRFMNLWYGFKCWRKNGQWPIRILYFNREHKLDGELFPKIHAEIEKNPRAFSD